MSALPRWTVVYNIVSKESPEFVGTGWEFFDEQVQGLACYDRQIDAGNVPTLRPFHEATDRPHMGAVHQMRAEP